MREGNLATINARLSRPSATKFYFWYLHPLFACERARRFFWLSENCVFVRETCRRRFFWMKNAVFGVKLKNQFEKSNLFCIYGYRSLQNRTESEIF